ncbi:hypothetical protein V8B97DRAFT_2016920 [Scleroderma yunnanense]
MPIAPITGKLRKRLWLDLSVALGLGVAAAYGFWYVWPVSSTFIRAHSNAGMVSTSKQCNVKNHSISD